MRIKKVVDNNFTVVHNAFLRDKNLGINARGILVTMLSLPDGWNFSIKGLSKVLPDGESKIAAALKDLEKNGYLMRKRICNDLGKVVDWQYIISDEPLSDDILSQSFKSPHLENPDVENPDVDFPDVAYPDVENRHDNKILSNQILINQELSNQSTNQSDRLEMVDRIKENISYELICTDGIKSILDEIVELIVDCCTLTHPIKINKQDVMPEIVKSRMLKLNSEHISYVLSVMDENKNPVKNVRSYLITVLYNAVSTMDNYYRNQAKFTCR